jgi:hypothetical protein
VLARPPLQGWRTTDEERTENRLLRLDRLDSGDPCAAAPAAQPACDRADAGSGARSWEALVELVPEIQFTVPAGSNCDLERGTKLPYTNTHIE